jgi:hypothetical protein
VHPVRSASHACEPRLAQLFDEVHRSNMSKACASREEAEATVADYAGKGQPAHIEEVEGKFLVKRTADNKVQPLRTATTPAAPARAQHGHLTCISPASHLHPTNAPPTTGAQERQVFAGRARAHTRRTVQLTIGRLEAP